jgi:hypothetical protein
MIGLLEIIKKNKIDTFISILSSILLIIIILNSFYPRQIEFNKYYMIIVSIIALYWFINIGNYIHKENWEIIKYTLLDSRIFFLIALIFLFYTPFYIILEDKRLAEKLSIYAYYFLVLWVIYEIVLSKFNTKIESNKNIEIHNKQLKEKRLKKISSKWKK